MDGVLFGTEQELGSQLRRTHSNSLPADSYIDEIIRQGTGVQITKNDNTIRAFLQNGARLYSDVYHVEYSTPECKSLFDLVGYEAAIGFIIEDICKIEGFGGRVFIKNNIDYCGNCFGYHENYHFLGNFSVDDVGRFILPHLVSRQIISGSGTVLKGRPGFAISQRPLYTTKNASHTSTGNGKPVLSLRDEKLASVGKRLHVVCGDANIAQIATALKVGSTALVVRLIDDGWRPAYIVQNSEIIFRDLALETAGWVVKTNKGLKTAPEIQREHWEAARQRFYSNGDIETKWVIDTWNSVLSALEKSPPDLEALVGKLDWPTKFLLYDQLIDKKLARHGTAELEKVDLAYHTIGDPLSEELRLEILVGKERIKALATNPPADTRAYARGTVIKTISLSQERLQNWLIDWDRIQILTRHQNVRTAMYLEEWQSLELHDPRRNYEKEVTEFLFNI